MNKTLTEYLSSDWDSMERHINQLEALGRNDLPQWCVVEGDTFRAAPEKMLKRLCHVMGITYVPNMIKGWRAGSDKMVGMKGVNYARSWLGRVKHTNALIRPKAMTPRLEDFHSSVRLQVVKNLRKYIHFLAQPHALLPTPQELKRMMDKENFAHICPIASYSMVALWSDEFAQMRERTLQKIRLQEADYISSYELIDHYVQRERARIMRAATPKVARHYSAVRLAA